MNPGERQVAPTLDGVRADHRARYEFAARYFGGKSILDCGCGVGYGAYILAQSGSPVFAFDVDAEAIAYAQEHYAAPGVDFTASDAANYIVRDVEAAVCFEMLEHVDHPGEVLRHLARMTDRLVCSVPNESVFRWHAGIKYHKRHYTAEQFEAMLNRSGWEVVEWHGQSGMESPVEPNIQGRTLVAVCHKAAEAARGGTWKTLPAPVYTPMSVAIVAMGSSARQYLILCNQLGDRRRVADETWAINSMGGVIQHDLLFHMDDCRIQESRAQRDPYGNVAGMLRWLKTHPRFMTSKAYPDDYPGAIEFPLQDVIRHTGNAYFNNTVAYAVAYAIHVGVKRLVLYGCDFSYPDLHKAEKGRACVEFWMATAAARGIAIEVSAESTLFDANAPEDQRFYGYDAEHVRLEADGKTGVKVTRTPRETLPTAEEIEQRYNHVPRATVA